MAELSPEQTHYWEEQLEFAERAVRKALETLGRLPEEIQDEDSTQGN